MGYQIDLWAINIQVGADLGFSRGGISTNFFIEVGQIDFPSSPKSIKTHGYGQIFCAVSEFLKKRPKKFLGIFWTVLTEESCFSERSPHKPLLHPGILFFFCKIPQNETEQTGIKNLCKTASNKIQN